MRSFTSIAAVAVAVLPCIVALPEPSHKRYNMDAGSYKSDCVLKTDVVVVGGGGVGTYAAIQLKDQGKKVIVIEKKARIGGHTETYVDPESDQPIDMGVKLYHDEPIVYEWFSRFNLSTQRFDLAAATTLASQNVDFRTGQVLEGLPAVNQTRLALALARYAAAIQQYPQLEGGFYLPDPVPEDLYMPFGKFVEKYGIADAAQFIMSLTPASGEFLELPALQQIRTMSLGLVASINNLQTSSVNSNSLLFERATDELLAANALLLSSNVLATERVDSTGAVKVLVDTPKGRKLILAKKLLLTIPPLPAALANFDTNKDELSVFSQFTSQGYYTSIVRNAGPANLTIQNLAIDTPFAFPPMPAIYNVNPTGVNPSLSLVYYGTKMGEIISPEAAKAAIIADLKRFKAANGIAGPDPEFVAFADHSPYSLLVGVEATKNGFYKQLYALQGKRNTFWSGAAWRAHDSSSCWAYTKNSILPALVASLG